MLLFQFGFRLSVYRRCSLYLLGQCAYLNLNRVDPGGRYWLCCPLFWTWLSWFRCGRISILTLSCAALRCPCAGWRFDPWSRRFHCFIIKLIYCAGIGGHSLLMVAAQDGRGCRHWPPTARFHYFIVVDFILRHCETLAANSYLHVFPSFLHSFPLFHSPSLAIGSECL